MIGLYIGIAVIGPIAFVAFRLHLPRYRIVDAVPGRASAIVVDRSGREHAVYGSDMGGVRESSGRQDVRWRWVTTREPVPYAFDLNLDRVYHATESDVAREAEALRLLEARRAP